MNIHILRDCGDGQNHDLREQNYRLRRRVSIEGQGWEATRRTDGRDIDASDTAGATHIPISDNGEVIGGSRITQLNKPNLLQTVFNGLVQGDFPGTPSHGADRTRFYVRPDRRGGCRRIPGSAALFCTMMEYALTQGYSVITFVSSIYMLKHGASVGWRITAPGDPVMLDGRATGVRNAPTPGALQTTHRFSNGLTC